ncbi:cytochrome P450 [Streptomyces sp. NPDC050658]|uniref:cytochrome P450 n=1 Tax=unclassified Streptomyces TaxID=2593676 RepID=UPI003427F0F9
MPATDTAPCPPAPGGLPLLGHAPALLRRPLSFFESTHTADPLVRVGFGPVSLYLANEPALVHRIQVDTDAFERGRFFESLAGHFGNPLIATNGAAHRHQRRVLKPAFSRRTVRGHIQDIADEADRLFSSWQPGTPVAADEAVSDLVAAVVLRSLFGVALAHDVVRDIRQTFFLISRRLISGTVFPDFLATLPTPGNRRFNAAVGRFYATIDALIRDRRAHPADTHDVLDLLLASTHPATGLPYTDEEIRSEALMILFAALETTSTSLTWAVFETTTRPKVQQRVYEEAVQVLDGSPVTQERLKELPYTRRVIDETLRLHAPMLFTRRARHDVELAGVRVPAGAEVGYSPRAMHRNPATYAQPWRFDPERRESELGQDLPRGAYFPWGTGPHRCIGEHLAATTMTVALASLVARWRLRIAPGTRRIRETNSSLPHPSSLPLVVAARA